MFDPKVYIYLENDNDLISPDFWSIADNMLYVEFNGDDGSKNCSFIPLSRIKRISYSVPK